MDNEGDPFRGDSNVCEAFDRGDRNHDGVDGSDGTDLPRTETEAPREDQGTGRESCEAKPRAVLVRKGRGAQPLGRSHPERLKPADLPVRRRPSTSSSST